MDRTWVLAHAYNPRNQAVEVGEIVNSRPNKQTNKMTGSFLCTLKNHVSVTERKF